MALAADGLAGSLEASLQHVQAEAPSKQWLAGDLRRARHLDAASARSSRRTPISPSVDPKVIAQLAESLDRLSSNT